MTHLTRDAKQTEFLKTVAEGRSITYAAKLVGIGRKTAYNWRGADLEFAEAWNEAVDARGDVYEDLLLESAKSGNATCIIVGLKMYRRFIETQYVHVTHADLRERLKELAPDLPEDEAELAIQEAMKLLPAPRNR